MRTRVRRRPRWCRVSKGVSKPAHVRSPNHKEPQVMCALTWGFFVRGVEPPVGIEPTTFSLRGGMTPPHTAPTSTNTCTGGRTTPHDPHGLTPFRTTNSTTREGWHGHRLS